MKLSFTTLACPLWDLATIIGEAQAAGYQAVDFRGYREHLQLWQAPEFSTGVRETARRLADAGLTVSAFSSSAHVYPKNAEDGQASVEEVRRYVDLCQILGARQIRVFGGAIGDTPHATALAMAVEQFHRMLAAVEGTGVELLLETHDHWITAAPLRELLEKVNHPAAAILWDVHHPWRMAGEQPDETWATIGRWVRNTHWKDSFPTPGEGHGYRLCLCGQGDIPYPKMLAVLRAGGYDGYLTLEWEKRWHPEIEEPAVALPHFARHMRALLAALPA